MFGKLKDPMVPVGRMLKLEFAPTEDDPSTGDPRVLLEDGSPALGAELDCAGAVYVGPVTDGIVRVDVRVSTVTLSLGLVEGAEGDAVDSLGSTGDPSVPDVDELERLPSRGALLKLKEKDEAAVPLGGPYGRGW